MIIERFLSKIIIQELGCWEWQGALTEKGYGIFWDGSINVSAHRYSYEWFNNCKLPKYIAGGLQIDHLCRNRRCVNPDHLELVTQRENLKRGNTGWYLKLKQTSKTHCPQGHPYNKENTYITPNNKRQCKICKNTRQIIKRESLPRRWKWNTRSR